MLQVRLFGLRRELEGAAGLEAEMEGDSPQASEVHAGDRGRSSAGRRQGARARDRTEEKGRELCEMLKARLELVCSHSSNAFVSSMDTWHDEIVCLGDMVASAVLLRFSPKDNAFKEIARDTNACWTLAVSCLSPNLHYLADADRNIWLLERASLLGSEGRREEGVPSTRPNFPAETVEECSICHQTPAAGGCLCSGVCVRMSGVSYIHVGVSINKFISFPTHQHRASALVSPASRAEASRSDSREADADPRSEAHAEQNGEKGGERTRKRGRTAPAGGTGRRGRGAEETNELLGRRGRRGMETELSKVVVGENSKLWASSEGAIGHLLQIPDEQTFARLAVLQDAVTKVTKSIGKLSAVAFHSVKVGTATVPSKGFIDGDILERFLEFPPSVQRSVYEMAQLNGRIAHLTLPPLEKVVQEIEELQRRH
uniref:CPSF A subunit region protein n=1 Tax=Toxoplasma gondii TgCATBr9 TaxID=943120 RepID=A0A2T6IJD3_TOXGO|nr:CPSF A subunit region protein [Toxoplasma gondii TgCATBr9]